MIDAAGTLQDLKPPMKLMKEASSTDMHLEMTNFDKTYSEEIKLHLDANAYTDRRFAGSVVGTGVGGSLGFIAFSGALSFGLGGCKKTR